MKIIISGASGFISSGLIAYFNDNHPDIQITAVDKFNIENKANNLKEKKIYQLIDRDDLFKTDTIDFQEIHFIFHLGARTDTTEMSVEVFDKLNLNYSKNVWQLCCKHNIPLIYASSAATYGDGSMGFDDDESRIGSLKPLNPYGHSKNEFDKWALQQNSRPPFWAGLKFFNVYGPNEYHKGRMASVVFHAYNQILKTGKLKLFRSHNPDYPDGGQMRDFIYVKDLFRVVDHIFTNLNGFCSGIYNLGTGRARTFLDLGLGVFQALDIEPNIEFIDTPADIRDKYQYFTEANMQKLRQQGYLHPFVSLEEGISDYVRNYLVGGRYY